MTPTLRLCLPLLLAAPLAGAAQLSIEVDIPQLKVAEYHRPYIAVWIEREDASVAANLAVWYQQDKPGHTGDSGTKWLPDLRQWWRRSGRALSLPVDGVTGATRPAGTHAITLDDTAAPIRDLAPGSYRVVVEAVREVGGRELLKLPLHWPPADAQDARAQGESELGAIRLSVTP